jgi:uncharacterized membrane protein (DUF2068 family)
MESFGQRAPRPTLTAGFVAVIVFKYLKAAAFLLVGVVVLRIAHLPLHGAPMEIAEFLDISSARDSVQQLGGFFTAISKGQVKALGFAATSIGLVFAAEGTFLAARIWWATYFTIFLTALGIPVEIREILKSPGSLRLYLLLAINLAILFYVWKRRNDFRSPKAG